MADYTELVKMLRTCSERDSCVGWDKGCPYLGTGLCDDKAVQAADAIEELQGQIDGWIEPERKALIKSLPRWIPVTERLPENRKWVLVCSKFVKMKTDFISNDGKWHTTPGVTHWMPLPEPPEEET